MQPAVCPFNAPRPLAYITALAYLLFVRCRFDRSMKTLINTLIFVLPLVCQAQLLTDPQTVQWVFLNTGSAREKVKGMAKEEVSKMQAAHVGNFGTLFDQGRLFTAGPLGDNGWIRGIVVLAATNEAKARECFGADPFVQNGVLDAEMHPWRADIMKFCSPRVPFQITQHTLCIVQEGQELGKNQDKSH